MVDEDLTSSGDYTNAILRITGFRLLLEEEELSF
jgi:hypothetical protein